jgi:hypothetical protein
MLFFLPLDHVYAPGLDDLLNSGSNENNAQNEKLGSNSVCAVL